MSIYSSCKRVTYNSVHPSLHLLTIFFAHIGISRKERDKSLTMASLKYVVVFSLLMVMLAHHCAESMTIPRLDMREAKRNEELYCETEETESNGSVEEDESVEDDNNDQNNEQAEAEMRADRHQPCTDENTESNGGVETKVDGEDCDESTESNEEDETNIDA